MKTTGKSVLLALAFILFAATAQADHAVNINTASKAELETLQGIGEVKAQAIIDYRAANGPFGSIDDIQKVSGIGPSTYAGIKDHITVSGASAAPAEDDNEKDAGAESAAPESGSGSSAPPQRIAQVAIERQETIVAVAPARFAAQVHDEDGEPLYFGVRYKWNFGDGSLGEGAEAWHAYAYPGTYRVSVSAAHRGKELSAHATVVAIAPDVALAAMGDGSLQLANNTSSDIDMGGWLLSDTGGVFRIPQATYVAAKGALRLPAATTGLAGSMGAQLLFPNGALAAAAAAPKKTIARAKPPATVAAANAPAPTPAAHPSEPQAAAAALGGEVPMAALPWAGLAAVLVLGTAGAYVARAAGKKAETIPPAEEFEIE